MTKARVVQVATSQKGARDYFDVELRDGLPIALTLKCKADPLSNLFDDTSDLFCGVPFTARRLYLPFQQARRRRVFHMRG